MVVSRMLARSLAFVFAVAGVGCVATADTSEEELGTTSQALRIPIYFNPSWLRACPNGTYYGGSVTRKYYVRRAKACTDVVRTGGTWVGSRLFWESSQFCSYYWNNPSTTPNSNDYWALDAMGEMPVIPSYWTGENTINPLVIPNCQTDTVQLCGNGITCVATAATNTVCDSNGNCTVVSGKIVNPCGTCGVGGGPNNRIAVVVPPEWTRSELVINPWFNQHYGPANAQTFQAIPYVPTVYSPTGTSVQLGLRP